MDMSSMSYEQVQQLERDAGVSRPLEDMLAAKDLHPFIDWQSGDNAWWYDEHGPVTWYKTNEPLSIEDTKQHRLSKLLQATAMPMWWRMHDQSLARIRLASTAEGTPLGIIAGVELDALQALLAPSPFGRGTETVYDDAVRRGKEVTASQMHIVPDWPFKPDYDPPSPNPFEQLAGCIQDGLFPGRPVKIVFYKLALYEPGGHFQLHRDSTHADSHHGTLLLACSTRDQSYKGGELVLCGDGDEQLFSLLPGDALAFYTDVRHAVSPVTSGTRITLQFDIYLEDDSINRPHTLACVPVRINPPLEAVKPVIARYRCCSSCPADSRLTDCECWHDEDDLDPLREFITYYNNKKMYDYEGNSSRRSDYVPFASGGKGAQLTACPNDAADAFVSALVDTLHSPTASIEANAEVPRTVLFLLCHLYRRSSIQPFFLKGADAALYARLASIPQLQVQLHPVIYSLVLPDDPRKLPRQTLAFAGPFESGSPPTVEQPVLILDRGEGAMTHIHRGPLSTGNESVGFYDRYLAGAMFVTLAASQDPEEPSSATVAPTAET